MSDVIRYPWESRAQFMKDPLYAVKSLSKNGHYMIAGVPLQYGQWQLNVREREVLQKKLLEDSTECLCVTMAEYQKLQEEPVKPVEEPPKKVEEKVEEPVVEVEQEEKELPKEEPKEESKPKRKRRTKKSKDS